VPEAIDEDELVECLRALQARRALLRAAAARAADARSLRAVRVWEGVQFKVVSKTPNKTNY
jgi:hypothetical protein